MGIGHYLAGWVLSAGCLGAIAAGAWRVRSRLLPAWHGVAARIAETVIGLGLLLMALEIVGVLSLLTELGVVIACLIAGAAAWLGAGALPRASQVARTNPPGGRGQRVAAAVAVAVAAAPWLGWTVSAYRHGMATVDTLWYHLPTAARFLQLHSILHVQYFDASPVTAFYPASAELLQGFGPLMFGNDVLSPLINLGWAALALAAAWTIGRVAGRQAHCVILCSVLLATPGLVDTQPGGAYNDIACLALILAAVAVLVTGELDTGSVAVAAIAAGLALGVKFTMIAPAVLLAAGAIVAASRDRRLRQALVWIGGLVVLGGYWYLRNAVVVGNPLPSLSLRLGPLTLPGPHVSTPTFTVGQYLFNRQVWTGFFIPGLRQSLGLGWWAIILLAAAGAVSAMLTRADRLRMMLGALAVISAVAFLLTPQFLGLPGAPIFFVDNVRYAAVPLILGLVLLPLAPGLAGTPRGRALLVIALVLLAATELDPGVWRTGLGVKPFAPAIGGGAAAVGAALSAVGWILWWLLFARGVSPRRWFSNHMWGRPALAGAVASAVVVIVAAGWPLADSYAAVRYRSSRPFPVVYRWAEGLHGARIGIVGFVEQYPLYGTGYANYVQYVGQSEAHHGFQAITTCPVWRRAINRGHYGWVIIAPSGFQLAFAPQTAPEVSWTASSPAARLIISEHPPGTFRTTQVSVYRIHGELNPNTCGRQASASPGALAGSP